MMGLVSSAAMDRLEELLRAYRDQVENSAAPLMVELRKQLRHYFLSAHFSPFDADDLTHEVIVIVFEDLPGLTGRPSLRAWVFAIARNRGYEHHRRLGRRRETSMGHADHAPAHRRGLSSEFRLRRQIEAVKALLADLPRLWREVLECDLDGGSSAVLVAGSMSNNSARRGVRWRALKRLREALPPFFRDS